VVKTDRGFAQVSYGCRHLISTFALRQEIRYGRRLRLPPPRRFVLRHMFLQFAFTVLSLPSTMRQLSGYPSALVPRERAPNPGRQIAEQHGTNFDRVFSQPISGQTQLCRSSSAATKRQPPGKVMGGAIKWLALIGSFLSPPPWSASCCWEQALSLSEGQNRSSGNDQHRKSKHRRRTQ